MGKTARHKASKLIAGFIFKQEGVLREAQDILIRKFGPLDFESQILNFNYTDYYEKEFGKNLKRKFVSFKRLTNPAQLAAIKTFTNKVEMQLSKTTKTKEKARQINIDPGYLELSKVLLATTKDYTHRIYLKNGIFAEVTLYYRSGSYRPWEWTYPDYRTSQYIQIFNQIRQIYSRQIC